MYSVMSLQGTVLSIADSFQEAVQASKSTRDFVLIYTDGKLAGIIDHGTVLYQDLKQHPEAVSSAWELSVWYLKTSYPLQEPWLGEWTPLHVLGLWPSIHDCQKQVVPAAQVWGTMNLGQLRSATYKLGNTLMEWRITRRDVFMEEKNVKTIK